MKSTAEDAPDAEQDDRSGPPPWTIKRMPWEERNAAAKAAKRAKMFVGDWLAIAIRERIKAEQNAETGLVRTEKPTPTLIATRITPPNDRPEVDDVVRLVAVARELAELTGKPPPRDVTRLAYQQLRVRLRGGLTK